LPLSAAGKGKLRLKLQITNQKQILSSNFRETLSKAQFSHKNQQNEVLLPVSSPPFPYFPPLLLKPQIK